MSENNNTDETYTLIFSSLKHPLRRKILRILEKKSLTFSEILKDMSIDSGHLSYHLDGLGVLLLKGENGSYSLSSIGQAALKLMEGVEDENNSMLLFKKKMESMNKITTIITVLLIITLLPAIIYSFTYYIPAGNGFSSIGSRLVYSNETFNYSVLVNYLNGREVTIFYDTSISSTVPAPKAGFFEWEEDEVEFLVETFGKTIYKMKAFFPPNNVREMSFSNLSDNNNFLPLVIPLNGQGTVGLEIETIDSVSSISGNVTIKYTRHGYAKPFLVLGIIGAIIMLASIAGLMYLRRKILLDNKLI